MSLKFKPGHRIFVYSEYIDLRAGFDKLSMIVREKLKAQLVDGDLYVFFGRDRRKCKALCYDGTGVLLVAKRMERGRFIRLEELDEKEITAEELDWLLRGSIIRRPKFGEIPIDNRAPVVLMPAQVSASHGTFGARDRSGNIENASDPVSQRGQAPGR